MSANILEKAIKFEEEGIEFYSSALGIVRHEICRGIIQTLLDEERKHIRKLNNIYKELSQKGYWPEKETNVAEVESKDIFKKACGTINKTVKPSTDEKEFLDLCMALEIKGRNLYKKLSDEVEDEKEKDFYEILVNEEEKHYQFLEQYYNYYFDSGLRMQE